MKRVLGVLLLCMVANAASAQVWVDGRGQSCDIACNASGMAPVASGNYTNGQPFFMCAGNANGEGYRGGFNLRPTWANICTVGAGGRETSTSNYSCLCAGGVGAGQPIGPVAPLIAPAPQYSQAPVIVQQAPQPTGGRRVRIEEATLGLNCGLPRGNATAHVTRWCDGARDSCDYTIDPSVLGGTDSCQEDFSVRYHCGDDGRPKLAQVTFNGVMGQVLLSCP